MASIARWSSTARYKWRREAYFCHGSSSQCMVLSPICHYPSTTLQAWNAQVYTKCGYGLNRYKVFHTSCKTLEKKASILVTPSLPLSLPSTHPPPLSFFPKSGKDQWDRKIVNYYIYLLLHSSKVPKYVSGHVLSGCGAKLVVVTKHKKFFFFVRASGTGLAWSGETKLNMWPNLWAKVLSIVHSSRTSCG